MLDDFGLDKALARSVAQFEQQTGIETRYDASGPIDSVRDDYAIHVYRIVQEALANIGRHSGSHEAWVRLRGDEAALDIEVEDRGVGHLRRGHDPAGRSGHGAGQHARAGGTDGGAPHAASAAAGRPGRRGARARVDPDGSGSEGHVMSDRRIRVLLADDHALVRHGFRRILEDEPDIEVVGEAGGGAEAIALDRRLEPDVVVMDMAMPEINGLHASIEILRRQPARRVLMLSMYADEQYVMNALDAGVSGYILKNALETDLTRAVRVLAGGGQYLSPELSDIAIRRMRSRDTPPVEDLFGKLSQREIQVLRLIAMGRSNKEIAGLLGVSANTVAVHRANLMSTLGVHKAAELVLIAVKKGLVQTE